MPYLFCAKNENSFIRINIVCEKHGEKGFSKSIEGMFKSMVDIKDIIIFK